MTFQELKLNNTLLQALDFMGFKEATPIQQQAIPEILADRDIIACAQTGTGKTAAFILPVLDRVMEYGYKDAITTLILSPTRELAIQIDRQLDSFSYYTGLSNACVYGGNDSDLWQRQRGALENGAEFITATPGRLMAHMALGYVDLSKVKYLILDEADRMLDMGFYDDIMRIVSKLPTERRTLLFSATMPPKMRKLAKTILQDPAEISISISKPAKGVTQAAFMVHEDQKIGLIKHLTRYDDIESLIIFSSTKSNVRKIHEALERQKFSVVSIQSDMDQKEREDALRKFTNHEAKILVATDIVARGIDIENINMVINYDVPGDPEDYIHRIGRTARAASTGEAVTFITELDQHKFKRIEDMIEMEIRKIDVPEALGEAPIYNPNAKKPSKGNGGKPKKNWKKKPKTDNNNTN